MTRYTFYTGVPKGSSLNIEEACRKLNDWYGGYTLMTGAGGWTDEKGKQLQEWASRWECLLQDTADKYPPPDWVAEQLGEILGQQEVLWTKETLIGGFQKVAP